MGRSALLPTSSFDAPILFCTFDALRRSVRQAIRRMPQIGLSLTLLAPICTQPDSGSPSDYVFD